MGINVGVVLVVVQVVNLYHGFGHCRFSACGAWSSHLIHMIPTYDDQSLHLILSLQKHHILLHFLLHFTCYGNVTFCYVFCYIFYYILLLHFTCYGNITFCYIFRYIFLLHFFVTFFVTKMCYIFLYVVSYVTVMKSKVK